MSLFSNALIKEGHYARLGQENDGAALLEDLPIDVVQDQDAAAMTAVATDPADQSLLHTTPVRSQSFSRSGSHHLLDSVLGNHNHKHSHNRDIDHDHDHNHNGDGHSAAGATGAGESPGDGGASGFTRSPSFGSRADLKGIAVPQRSIHLRERRSSIVGNGATVLATELPRSDSFTSSQGLGSLGSEFHLHAAQPPTHFPLSSPPSFASAQNISLAHSAHHHPHHPVQKQNQDQDQDQDQIQNQQQQQQHEHSMVSSASASQLDPVGHDRILHNHHLHQHHHHHLAHSPLHTSHGSQHLHHHVPHVHSPLHNEYHPPLATASAAVPHDGPHSGSAASASASQSRGLGSPRNSFHGSQRRLSQGSSKQGSLKDSRNSDGTAGLFATPVVTAQPTASPSARDEYFSEGEADSNSHHYGHDHVDDGNEVEDGEEYYSDEYDEYQDGEYQQDHEGDEYYDDADGYGEQEADLNDYEEQEHQHGQNGAGDGDYEDDGEVVDVNNFDDDDDDQNFEGQNDENYDNDDNDDTHQDENAHGNGFGFQQSHRGQQRSSHGGRHMFLGSLAPAPAITKHRDRGVASENFRMQNLNPHRRNSNPQQHHFVQQAGKRPGASGSSSNISGGGGRGGNRNSTGVSGGKRVPAVSSSTFKSSSVPRMSSITLSGMGDMVSGGVNDAITAVKSTAWLLWSKYLPLAPLTLTIYVTGFLCLAILRYRDYADWRGTITRLVISSLVQDLGVAFLMLYSFYLAYPDVVSIKRRRNQVMYGISVLISVFFLSLMELYRPATLRDPPSGSYRSLVWVYNLTFGFWTFILIPLSFRREIKAKFSGDNAQNNVYVRSKFDWLELLCYVILASTSISELVLVFFQVDIYAYMMFILLPAVIIIIFRERNKNFQRDYTYLLLSSLCQFFMHPLSNATSQVYTSSFISSIVGEAWRDAVSRMVAMMFYYTFFYLNYYSGIRIFECSTTPSKSNQIQVRTYLLLLYEQFFIALIFYSMEWYTPSFWLMLIFAFCQNLVICAGFLMDIRRWFFIKYAQLKQRPIVDRYSTLSDDTIIAQLDEVHQNIYCVLVSLILVLLLMTTDFAFNRYRTFGQCTISCTESNVSFVNRIIAFLILATTYFGSFALSLYIWYVRIRNYKQAIFYGRDLSNGPFYLDREPLAFISSTGDVRFHLLGHLGSYWSTYTVGMCVMGAFVISSVLGDAIQLLCIMRSQSGTCANFI